MKIQIVNAKIVTPNEVLMGGVCLFEDGIISYVGLEKQEADETWDVKGAYLVAGFIDLHCHGGCGFDFMDANALEMRAISRFHLRHGTTTLYATTMTDKVEAIEKALDTYAETVDTPLTLAGVHLEGPWLNPTQCGAQDREKMSLPSKEKLIEWKEKYPFIKRVSVAPELPQGMEVGKLGKELGIVMSIAHTDADFDTTCKAYENGYTLATHLYSGMKGVERKNAFRIAGAVEGSLYTDNAFVEVIADGRHLPVSLLKYICKVKGYDKVCLVTDGTRGSGKKNGESVILGAKDGGVYAIIEDDVAKLPDRTSFAGSVATTDRLFKVMAKQAKMDIVNVSKMASANPAKVMGLDDRGEIAVGKRADFVLLNDRLEIRKVIYKGEIV